MGSTGDGAMPDSSEQYGTQDNPTRVTGQFLNGRGPDEVWKRARPEHAHHAPAVDSCNRVAFINHSI
jgi:hypothetical protein